MTTTRRFALYKPQPIPYEALPNWDGISLRNYSLFKHGCMASRQIFADELSSYVMRTIDNDKCYQIASSSYFSLPSAANQLLSDMLMDHLPTGQFELSRFRRNKVFSWDFAKQSRKNREESLHRLDFEFSLEELAGRSLVVVDDAYVTGSHERAIINRLDGVVSEILFFYLIDLSDCADPTLEYLLNTAEVKTLWDMIPIRNSAGFSDNNRTLKTIFSSTPTEFALFMSLLSFDQQSYLLDLAIKEGYLNLSDGFESKVRSLSYELDRENIYYRQFTSGSAVY